MENIIYCKGLSKCKSQYWEPVDINEKIGVLLDIYFNVKIGISFLNINEVFEFNLLNIVENYDNVIKNMEIVLPYIDGDINYDFISSYMKIQEKVAINEIMNEKNDNLLKISKLITER